MTYFSGLARILNQVKPRFRSLGNQRCESHRIARRSEREDFVRRSAGLILLLVDELVVSNDSIAAKPKNLRGTPILGENHATQNNGKARCGTDRCRALDRASNKVSFGVVCTRGRSADRRVHPATPANSAGPAKL